MKQIEKLQAKARQRVGFCGSLIIHFILFVALAFSGVFAMQPPAADADTVVFFDAGGGGGGGGDEAVADAADDGEEQVEEVVEEETITLPDGKIEHKQVVKHVVKHVPAGAKKGRIMLSPALAVFVPSCPILNDISFSFISAALIE